MFATQTLQSYPNGTLLASVSFEADTLGGLGLVHVPPFVSPWSNASRCPTETKVVRVSDCGWFSIIGSDGVAYNATATLSPDGQSLELAAKATAGVHAKGTAAGWGAWPVNSFYNAFGYPLEPWLVEQE